MTLQWWDDQSDLPSDFPNPAASPARRLALDVPSKGGGQDLEFPWRQTMRPRDTPGLWWTMAIHGGGTHPHMLGTVKPRVHHAYTDTNLDRLWDVSLVGLSISSRRLLLVLIDSRAGGG